MRKIEVKLLILYILFFCKITLSKKKDFDALRSGKIDECGRCKMLTESFNHWLERTSRGKFEGGDAAWEEKKLKSYSRSEIRLVEVQEGLCSEVEKHQDQCYSLAEEAEQALEKWWFHEDPNTVDLHSWLCIETLQHCCPQSHYGDLCTPCPLDKDNKVCGGNGKCNGDGSRKGNGTCLCRKGFTGKYCEHCAENFYSVSTGSCQQCHMACEGCSGEGAAACNTCKSGWQLVSGVCTDVNECNEPSNCGLNQFCVNTEGSHKCKSCDKSCETCSGAGSSNCTSCEPSSVLWTGVCVDEELRSELFNSALRRVGLYVGLLLISIIISRSSRILASLIVIVIAVYIYYYERMSKMNIFDVFFNVYLK